MSARAATNGAAVAGVRAPSSRKRDLGLWSSRRAHASVPSPSHVAPFEVPAEPPHDSLADIRDDVDEQVLPIFLEEAAELYPQAAEQVRGWRSSPSDAAGARHLRRTLHTFKGSARMAGAMRLGELAHRMESRLSPGESPIAATPELFEALDTDLDRIGYVLDALRAGKTNVAMPDALDAHQSGAAAGSAPVSEAASAL